VDERRHHADRPTAYTAVPTVTAAPTDSWPPSTSGTSYKLIYFTHYVLQENNLRTVFDMLPSLKKSIKIVRLSVFLLKNGFFRIYANRSSTGHLFFFHQYFNSRLNEVQKREFSISYGKHEVSSRVPHSARSKVDVLLAHHHHWCRPRICL
jgi:hypothetical protein